MKEFTLQTEVWLPRPRDEVFAFFGDARNLDALTPPWVKFATQTPHANKTMSAANAGDDKSDPSRATAGARGMPRPATGIGTLMASAMLVLAVPASVSCTAVPASRQQRLAKANMVFDDTNAFAFSARLQPQSEPGTSATGAAQGGGCTACK